jgi:hypothetical protein
MAKKFSTASNKQPPQILPTKTKEVTEVVIVVVQLKAP